MKFNAESIYIAIEFFSIGIKTLGHFGLTLSGT